MNLTQYLQAQDTLARLREMEVYTPLPKSYVRIFFLITTKHLLAQLPTASIQNTSTLTEKENEYISFLSQLSMKPYHKREQYTVEDWKEDISTLPKAVLPQFTFIQEGKTMSSEQKLPIQHLIEHVYIFLKKNKDSKARLLFISTFPMLFLLSQGARLTPTLLFTKRHIDLIQIEIPTEQDILLWFNDVQQATYHFLKDVEDIYEKTSSACEVIGRTRETAQRIFTHMIGYPHISLQEAIHFSGITKPNANILLKRLVKENLLQVDTKKKNKTYTWEKYTSVLTPYL